MADFRIEFEWVDPLGVRGEELGATWARLCMRVGDETVTRAFDERSRTIRESIYVPLYPLAEWLAVQWWSLVYELETPERRGEPEFRGRHSLEAAREGYSYPALRLHSLGEAVRLEWRRVRLSHHGIEFVSTGMGHIGLDDFRRVVSGFVESVGARLRECGVTSTLLQDEWSSITSSSPEEERFCHAAAALGHHPYEVDEQLRAAILQLSDVAPETLRHEFFAAAKAQKLGAHADQLSRALQATRENKADLPALRRLRQQALGARAGSPPWEQGWGLARQVRSHLGIGNEPLPGLGELGRALQVDEGELQGAVLDAEGGSPFFDAVEGQNARGASAFVVRPTRAPEARLFHVCRGLYEYLTGRDGTPSLMTRTVSDRQRRNRAFAAEFLAPAGSLKTRLEAPFVSMEEVDELARQFGVSYDVILHQLEIHRIAEVVGAGAVPDGSDLAPA